MISCLMYLQIINRLCRRRKPKCYIVGAHQLLTDSSECPHRLLQPDIVKQAVYPDLSKNIFLLYERAARCLMFTTAGWTLKINSLYAEIVERQLFKLLFSPDPLLLSFTPLQIWARAEPRRSLGYIIIIAQKALQTRRRNTAIQQQASKAKPHRTPGLSTLRDTAVDTRAKDTLERTLSQRLLYAVYPFIFEDHCELPLFISESSSSQTAFGIPGKPPRHKADTHGVFTDTNTEVMDDPNIHFLATPEMWLPGADCIYSPQQVSSRSQADAFGLPYEPYPEVWVKTKQGWPWDAQSSVDFLTSIS
ncbi:hypothetical protein OE88DRAFT_1655572 [Heliocybe sulcata]|uniref:Uncharacterized protein n=1 Tax=Heliocybe sulcata TaxID=5364 RepID=A0A5C3N8K3_9AGAM|nr:hypothetical protein OE88DRAFT_1655572 [Heliocybe sulcata]